jgi:hypothetical protein
VELGAQFIHGKNVLYDVAEQNKLIKIITPHKKKEVNPLSEHGSGGEFLVEGGKEVRTKNKKNDSLRLKFSIPTGTPPFQMVHLHSKWCTSIPNGTPPFQMVHAVYFEFILPENIFQIFKKIFIFNSRK